MIQCRPRIFALFRNPKILTRKSKPWVFGVKNMVLMKYPMISTGVKPGILIQCRPKIFALFKNPKILTSKSRTWVLGVKKLGSYEIPKILTAVLPDILIQWRPKISFLFKNPKNVTSKIGHGFLTSKIGSYEIPHDFDKC